MTDSSLGAENGLDNFGARYYGSRLGRFMSVDWSSAPEAVPYADFADPQSLNLYSYVRNNPLSEPDIDGHNYICVPCAVAEVKKFLTSPQGQQMTKGVGLIAAGGLTVVAVTQAEISVPVAIVGILSGTTTSVAGVTKILGAAIGGDTTAAEKGLGAMGTPAGLATTL